MELCGFIRNQSFYTIFDLKLLIKKQLKYFRKKLKNSYIRRFMTHSILRTNYDLINKKTTIVLRNIFHKKTIY